ncbi:hypothetical protein G5B37_13815 [Rasiella rasia]|uniref:Uncharacterized protein n=1 Tax=Rasiella rasia TaxID=2744027 RepID=A0A6G6GSB4_9FLAO|nr:hypothetical protein [Rasiella rasia]QIE60601.1 hypothetical protein G5B37_13815 [Rasiella rasia]
MKNLNSRGRRFRIFFLIFCALFVNINSILSQDFYDTCATEDGNNQDLSSFYSHSTAPIDFAVDEPVVLNVYYWQIKAPDGSFGGATFTEDTVFGKCSLLKFDV